MTKLLPCAAQGAAPYGLQDATVSRLACGLQVHTPACSSSVPDSAVNWTRVGEHLIRHRLCVGGLSLLSVTCSSRKSSRSSAGGKQAVLEKGSRTSVSPSKRKDEDSSDISHFWSAGETVTALEPREEGYFPSVGLYNGNSGPPKPPAERKYSKTPENAENPLPGPKGEEAAEKQSGEVEGDDEEEWVEIDDEEWDRRLLNQDEDVELVEVWEGDLGPMTAEDEAALLLEAEQEIAELERERLEKERSTSHVGASSPKKLEIPEGIGNMDVSAMEKELARLKDLVSTMEEQIAEEKGRRIENSLSVTAPTVQALPSFTAVEDGEIIFAADHSREGQGGDNVGGTSTSKFLEVYTWDEEEGIVRRSDKQQSESPYGANDGTPVNSLITARNLKGVRMERQPGRHMQAEENDEDLDMEGKEKRSIPAVMRCFDRAKIYVKAGDGGDGVVAFRREKFVPFGGPSGGNGGDGGDVYLQADTGINSLLPFRRTVHFRATRGSHGQGKGKSGATGDHCTVKVPVGTTVKKAEGSGDILLELLRPGQRELLLPGGRGGRGNAAFKTGRNKTPQIAENGEEGAEMWLELELKLVADVGIIGVPNAGKSTLLSAISAARPEIANYPFTTLLPNLGVVDLGFDAAMVVADLPGLLEGAHTGYGLGHEFLRHTERCRVLVHVVDGMSQQAQYEYEAVRLELQLFNPELEHKPFLVAYNKMDVPEAAERWEDFQDFMRSKGVEPFCMSAATRTGTDEITKAAYDLSKRSKQTEPADETLDEAREQNMQSVGEMVRRQRSAPIEDFKVTCDKHTRTWQIDGVGLNRFTQMTNWEYFEAVRRFQHVLNASGVSKTLREQGVREGDTVIVGELEFNWIDSDDMRSLGEWKRGIRGSKVWPH